jgi:hypothetical protein
MRATTPFSVLFHGAAIAVAAALVAAAPAAGGGLIDRTNPAPRLSETGLYSDAAGKVVARENLSFSPQYPLWTDGATKRRWIYLPPGTSIDAADPDAWVFPVGTKLWKEFSFGKPVETRLIERLPDGSWRFLAYVWKADGSDAELAPVRGVRGVVAIKAATAVAAGQDTVRHDVPSRMDCGACHEGQPSPVLGFSALQLSPDRDPLAPHATARVAGDVDLRLLMDRGLVRGLPASYRRTPPRIAAPTPRERAVLGYLHANCGHCHNDRGPLAELGMNLSIRLAPAHGAVPGALLTAVGQASSYPLPGTIESGLYARIANGSPGESVLVQRMVSRQPAVQMPPLGTHVVDREALRLVMQWIRESLAPTASSRVAERVPTMKRTRGRNTQ